MLESPQPRAFTQELRQVARKLKPSQTLLVLEGGGDRRALGRRLGPEVVIRVAGGKETLLLAYDELEAGLRDRTVFLSDCDGNLHNRHKGQVDLVISVNRDVEADLVFVFDALPDLILGYLPEVRSQGDAMDRARLLSDDVIEISTRMGAILTAARDLDLQTNVKVAGVGKRVVNVSNLGDVMVWETDELPTVEALVSAAASVLGWGMAETEAVRDTASDLLARPCRRHSTANCGPCGRLKYAVGHQLVAAAVHAVRQALGIRVREDEVSNLLHASISQATFDDWEVRRRLDAWSRLAGVQLWR